MNKEKTVVKVYALILVTMILTITLGFMGVKLSETQKRLEALEKDTNESFLDQQAQINTLYGDVQNLWNNAHDLEKSLEKKLEAISEEVEHTKQVQSNTNGALTRLRKQKEDLEKRLEEGLELRRQQLEQARAWASAGSGWGAIGNVFELTAYAWSGDPCANGEYPILGYTVASNWFPIGTRLYIEGIGERVVTDTGGMSNNVIDIYMGDPETCWQFGRQTAEVTVIED